MNLGWTKVVELENGVVLNYWEIVRINVDVKSAVADVLIHGFVAEGKTMVVERTVAIDFSPLDQGGQLSEAVKALVMGAI